jgi:hypothetical protein
MTAERESMARSNFRKPKRAQMTLFVRALFCRLMIAAFWHLKRKRGTSAVSIAKQKVKIIVAFNGICP